MTERAQAAGQAPAQGTSGQAPQGAAQGQQPESMTAQVFGQAPEQSGNDPQAADPQAMYPGIKQGETPTQWGQRMAKEASDARRDAGRYRTELRSKVGETTPGEDGKTEFQRLQDQLGNLQGELEQERSARKADKMQAQVITALAEAGAISPVRIVRLLELADADIDTNGVVSPEALAYAISQLKSEMPQVFTDLRGTGDGGAGNQGPTPIDFNDQIRQRARR